MKRILFVALGLVCLGGFSVAQPAFDPESTLFLTWADDPGTTMTVQWLEAGDLPDAVAGSASGDDLAHRVPRLEGIEIDGDGKDWGVAGFRLDYLGRPDGGWPDPTGFSATAKIGWSEEALLVLVTVVDDEATEAKEDDELYLADGVELFVADAWGGSASVQVIVSPGLDPEHPELRTQVLDRRGFDRIAPVEVQAASRKTEEGYVVEMALPWVGIADAKPGAMPAMQLIVNDVDGPFDLERLAWFPGLETYADLTQMKRLELGETAESAGDPVRAMVTMRVADEADKEHDGIAAGRVVLDFGGEPRLIGEKAVVRSGTHKLATVTLDRVSGFAGKVIVLPAPPKGEDGAAQRWPAVTVHLDDQVVTQAAVSDAVWRTSPAARAGIAVSAEGLPHDAVSTAAPFGDGGLFRQRLEFVGLAPGGFYEGMIDGMPEVFGFKTAPENLEAPLVFAEGGDVGTSRKYVAPLHETAASWDPLFGVVGGDLAYANGVKVKVWVKYLQLWSAHMRVPSEALDAQGFPLPPRLIPMLVTIGNHEVAGGFGKRRADAPFFFALFDGLFAKRSYAALDFGGTNKKEEAQEVPPYLSLMLLDSGHTAPVAGRQAQWLGEQLEARKDVPHVFAVYHVPAYPSHRPPEPDHVSGRVMQAIREQWVPLFEEYGVDIAFEHHDHTYKRTRLLDGKIVADGTPGSVLYLGDGAWGMGGREAKAREYLEVSETQRHVLRIEISPDGSRKFSAVNVEGGVIDEGAHDAQ